MAEKIKEVPSFTKPVGGLGDERKHPKGDKVDYSKYEKTHPHHNEGYSKVGSGPTADRAGNIVKKNPARDHINAVKKAGGGYSKVGQSGKGCDGKSACGAERQESAYKKKPPTR